MTMTRPRALPEKLGTSFSTSQALACGVTVRRLRAKDLTRPFRGTRRRVPAFPASDEKAKHEKAKDDPYVEERARRKAHLENMRLLATVMEPGTFFTGRTAAFAFGAPISAGELLEVATIAPRRAPKRQGVRGRKIARHLVELCEYEGMPLATPASTWAMLASELEVRELVAVGDWFVRIPRDKHGIPCPEDVLATIDDLKTAADAGPRPGRPKLMVALELIRVGSSSPLESDFRIDAQLAGLPTAALDVEIRDERGHRLGISELVFPEYRVVVEIEGDHHRTSRDQWHRDIDKYEAYKAAGWDVVRLTSLHVRRSREGLMKVAAALRRHGWDGEISPR